MKVFELTPSDSRKSFYKKAIVIIDDNGEELLKSYNTIVAKKDKDGNIKRLWDGWSATTGRHLTAWAGIDKKKWDSMMVE